MRSGGKVRDQKIVNAFCQPGETLVGWLVAGTPLRALRAKREKPFTELLYRYEERPNKYKNRFILRLIRS